jgi:tRNA(Ile)-lysidine synthase
LRLFFHLPDFSIVERVRSLARMRAGALPVPGGWVEKTASALIFHRDARGAAPRTTRRPFRSPHIATSHARLPVPGRTRYATRTKTWRIRTRFVPRLPAAWKQDPRRVFVDADRLAGPALFCRSWRPGDRFRPLGLKGSKKLQDLFTDARVPRAQRADVPVLEDARGIVWVAGLRISDGAKLSPATRRIVEISARAQRA